MTALIESIEQMLKLFNLALGGQYCKLITTVQYQGIYTTSILQTFPHLNNIVYAIYLPHIAGWLHKYHRAIAYCINKYICTSAIINRCLNFLMAPSYYCVPYPFVFHCNIAAIIMLPLVAIITINIFSIAQPHLAYKIDNTYA